MKVKGMIESDVDTFKVGDVIEVKLTYPLPGTRRVLYIGEQ